MDDIAKLLAVVLSLGMPIIIIAIIFFFRSRDRADMQKTIRMAIERGEALPPDLLDNLRPRKKPKTPMNDIRAGIILIAVAIGMMTWRYIAHGSIGGDFAGLAAIPGCIGVALLLLGIIGSMTRKD